MLCACFFAEATGDAAASEYVLTTLFDLSRMSFALLTIKHIRRANGTYAEGEGGMYDYDYSDSEYYQNYFLGLLLSDFPNAHRQGELIPESRHSRVLFDVFRRRRRKLLR